MRDREHADGEMGADVFSGGLVFMRDTVWVSCQLASASALPSLAPI